jgi:DNA-binding MarR family transcriptional regulator
MHYTVFMKPTTPRLADPASAEITRDCILTRTRRISRVLTAIYDQELRPFGINAPQFSLLVLIAELGPISRSDLGKRNHQGPSTLSRNLQLLISQGWVSEGRADEGGRRKPMSLTEQGRALMRDAASAWSSAQAKAKELLGESGASLIMEIANALPKDTG